MTSTRLILRHTAATFRPATAPDAPPAQPVQTTIHGRAWLHGMWMIVHTPAGASRPESTSDEASFSQHGQPIAARTLPIVTEDGQRDPHPGVVSVGRATARGKLHFIDYSMRTVTWTKDQQRTRSMCGTKVKRAQGGNLRDLINQDGTCQRCATEVKAMITAL